MLIIDDEFFSATRMAGGTWIAKSRYEKNPSFKSHFAGVINLFLGDLAITAVSLSMLRPRIAKLPESVLKIPPTKRVDRRFVP